MRQLMQLPLCGLILAKNVRVNPGDAEELRKLGESAVKQLIHPLIVRLSNKVVVDGTRRVLGMRLVLGDKSDHPVDCVVTDENLSDGQIIEINLVTAMHRKGLTGYEQWQGCLKLVELHPEWQGKELAAALSLNEGTISKLRSPSKCLPAWQEALQAGRVTISDCVEAAKLSDCQQHDLLAARLNGASRELLKQQTRKVRNGLNKEAKASKVRIPYPGGSVVMTGEKLGMSEIVEMLEGILKDARKTVGVYDVKTWQAMMRDKQKGNEP